MQAAEEVDHAEEVIECLPGGRIAREIAQELDDVGRSQQVADHGERPAKEVQDRAKRSAIDVIDEALERRPEEMLHGVGPVGSDPVEPGLRLAPAEVWIGGREVPLHLEIGKDLQREAGIQVPCLLTQVGIAGGRELGGDRELVEQQVLIDELSRHTDAAIDVHSEGACELGLPGVLSGCGGRGPRRSRSSRRCR